MNIPASTALGKGVVLFYERHRHPIPPTDCPIIRR
jgi:hypothetical protein